MLELIGELLLHAPAQAGRPAHISSASGLVRSGRVLMVVADDEPVLGVFARPGEPGDALPLEQHALPLDHAARKAAKPDLESLTLVPGWGAHPHGAALALGSGATAQRRRGWLIGLDVDGLPTGSADEISLAPLYDRLGEELADLNVEGAAVHDGSLWLAQRGNGANGVNALIELDLGRVLGTISDAGAITADAVLAIERWSLGEDAGVPLGFSDLTPVPGGLLFCAVAEAVPSTYDDGPCVAAGLGRLDPRAGRIAWFREFAEPHKVEGVTVADDGLLLVADPDAPETAAPLFGVAFATLPP